MVSRIISNDGRWVQDFQAKEAGVVGGKPALVVAPRFPPLAVLHSLLLPLVSSPYSNYLISLFQRACFVQTENQDRMYGPVQRICGSIFRVFFKSWSVAGEEIFSLMPLLFWFYLPVSLPFATNFGVVLTLGQLVKDVLLLPRPPAFSYFPGTKTPITIVKLEKHFETEYGFPSTHTMSGMLPFAVYFALQRPYLSSWSMSSSTASLFFNGCVIYTFFVAVSRLYMGVHSPADILGGLLIGGLSIYALHLHGDAFDSAVYTEPYGIALSTAMNAIYLTCYPKARPWSASFGTATQIYGTWAGVASALWFIHHIAPQLLRDLQSSHLEAIQTDPISAIANLFFKGSERSFDLFQGLIALSTCVFFRRIIVGSVSTALAKVVSKIVATPVFTFLHRNNILLPRPHSLELKDAQGRVVPESKLYYIEVPVRMCSYGAVAWSTIVFTPRLWRQLGLVN